MTREHLTQLVAHGEGLHVEFKQRVPAPERFAKEITAFANTSGGYLLIGVEDDGMLCGLKDAAEEEYALKKALASHTIPVVNVEVKRVQISRTRVVIVVTVRESKLRPHYVLDSATERRLVYVRIEDKSVEASREARKLMHHSSTNENVLIELRQKETILLRYLENHGHITVRQFAHIAGIPCASASRTLVRLTRAEVLEHHADLTEDYFTHGRNLAPSAIAKLGSHS